MDNMPEVFNDFGRMKRELDQSNANVLYCTPETAVWLVDEEYEPRLRLGDAVKIEKRDTGYLVVPVRWQRDEIMSTWDWVEVDEAFIGVIKDIE
jgi:hypothetical protein